MIIWVNKTYTKQDIVTFLFSNKFWNNYGKVLMVSLLQVFITSATAICPVQRHIVYVYVYKMLCSKWLCKPIGLGQVVTSFCMT